MLPREAPVSLTPTRPSLHTHPVQDQERLPELLGSIVTRSVARVEEQAEEQQRCGGRQEGGLGAPRERVS